MEKAFAKIEELADSIKAYVNTSIESVKLNAADKAAGVIGNLVAVLLVMVVLLFFIGFASIALAIVLGEWIGIQWAGFLMVAVFYLLIAIIMWFARGSLIRIPVMNALIQQLFKNDEEDSLQ